jgi:type IX secretion system PorP/SprF family membrane protein
MNGEAKLQPRQLERDFVGVGLLFNSDRAGDARYGTTQFYGSASYIHQVRSDSTFILSAGMNMGWCQVGFDFSKMTFDNQYESGQYNAALPSGEQFSWIRRSFFDLNAGAAMQYINEKRQVLTLGIGVYHVTSPVISYQGNDVSKLDYKFSNYLSWQMPLDHASDLVTEALVAFQGKNYELIPYAAWRYHVNREQRKSILAGASFRARDAVILRLGYNHGSMQSGISYDINISRFTPATNRRGGFEIFLNYIIRLKPSFIARKRVCPVSM